MTICPKCNATVNEEDLQCPQCGIYFSKWREREENVASGNLSRYAALATATSSGFNWTILFLVCTVIVGIFYFLSQRAID